jgi:LAGLIDADG DNA endonuclease family protein
LIRGNLDCGNVYSYKEESIIEVTKLKDLNKKGLNHFTLYPLMNIKHKRFIIWCDILVMIENKEH